MRCKTERYTMDFEIVTDSSANLTDDIIEEFGLHILSLTYLYDGEEHLCYDPNVKTDLAEFYAMMRAGKVVTTSLPNQGRSEAVIRSLLDAGRDVLYIGFSSGISGTYEATAGTLDALRSQYPDRKIFHTDTRAAAMGEGLLVYKAACMARDGASIEAVHSWIEANKFNLAHWFTVDDLIYLFRGGRVSRTSAWAGSLLNIKPVLHVDNAGHLIPMEKVRGRKKSVNALFDHMVETAIDDIANDTVFISHGDCIEDAEHLADMVRNHFGVKDIRINMLDPVIGAHSGPGTLALFFMATKR